MTELTGDNWRIIVDDVRSGLRTLPDKSVHCAVTSPPYWGLRDYKTGRWEGGEASCNHVRNHGVQGKTGQRADRTFTAQSFYKSVCGKCGAKRIDRQIGSEPTIAEFIETMVEVFREVRRVLRDDGTIWLNMGDSYSSGGRSDYGTTAPDSKQATNLAIKSAKRPPQQPGLKPKDLCGVPWRLALALQDDGWYLRSDIIWAKPNPMPSSVTDRPTTAHEYVFLLSKSARYFYDAEAIAEPASGAPSGNKTPKSGDDYGRPGHHVWSSIPFDGSETRNARTVWTIPTQAYSDAHFATFPEKLPMTCIKAGTSEHGCCAECAAPYRRVLESERVRTRPGRDSKSYDRTNGEIVDDGIEKPWRHQLEIGNRDPGRHISVKRTVGWEPTCKCNSDKPRIRATVLEPFAGSGTTLAVALQLDRQAIGIELNPDYAKLAEKRITRSLRPQTFRDETKTGDAPLFESVA